KSLGWIDEASAATPCQDMVDLLSVVSGDSDCVPGSSGTSPDCSQDHRYVSSDQRTVRANRRSFSLLLRVRADLWRISSGRVRAAYRISCRKRGLVDRRNSDRPGNECGDVDRPSISAGCWRGILLALFSEDHKYASAARGSAAC